MRGLTGGQWLICVIAAIGFAFDIYELLMLPLIVRPALMELGGFMPGTPEFNLWVGLLFYVPAVAGGIFGLLGGYLTDRLGRRRVLTGAFCSTRSRRSARVRHQSDHVAVLRCTTFIGVCVEFVAAVAWLAELFPDPKQREKVLGYTQAFSSIGGFLVSGANCLAVTYASFAAGHPRRPRRLALHADVRLDPGDSADPDSAVPAGVAGVAGEEGGGHA